MNLEAVLWTIVLTWGGGVTASLVSVMVKVARIEGMLKKLVNGGG